MEHRVGFGPRAGALIVDFILIMVASFFLGGTLGGIFGAAGGAAGVAATEAPDAVPMLGGIAGGVLGAMLGMYLIAILYGLVEAFTGASPGKMILKIKIANADGTTATQNTYLKRFAIKNVGSILGFVAALTGMAVVGTVGSVLGFIIFLGLFLVFTANKQALHDILAKTAVYRTAVIVPQM